MTNVTLAIQGMTCNHCVMRVQKALADVPGVRRAVVTLEPGQAKVEYDDSAATTDAQERVLVRLWDLLLRGEWALGPVISATPEP